MSRPRKPLDDSIRSGAEWSPLMRPRPFQASSPRYQHSPVRSKYLPECPAGVKFPPPLAFQEIERPFQDEFSR